MTASTIRYRPGDLVLLSFPFSKETGTKQRPALVLLDTGDNDVIVARITTQLHLSKHDVEIRNWRSAGLIGPSIVRLHKLVTLEKSLVIRHLGHLSDEDWEFVRVAMNEMFGAM